jgi:ABC-2 type transport system permease protein
MNTRRIYAIVLRQFYLLRGSPSRIVPYFLWSSLDIILWGFITKFLSGISGGAIAFVAILLGAVILWDFFTRAMQGLTTAFFEDVWSRNFLNLFSSPLALGEYILGLTAASIITTTGTFVLMLGVAALFFKFTFVFLGLAIFPFLIVLFLIGIALGIFAVGIVLRLGPSAEWFIWPIPAILTPFVGVFYPISTLPLWMQWIARILPPSYVFEGMRTVVAHGEYPFIPLLIAALLACIYIALAYWFLRTIYRHALRTGLLARYSAENTV